MGVESIFSKSWKEFGNNWKLSLKLSWWLIILPMIALLLLFSFIAVGWMGSVYSGISKAALENDTSPDVLGSFLTITGNSVNDSGAGSWIVGAIVWIILVSIVFVVLYLILSSSLLFISVYNEKGGMKTGQAIKGGLKYFWRILGLMLIMYLIFLGIFAADVIVSILFYLAFGVFGVFLIILLAIASLCLIIYLSTKWIFSVFVLFRENTKIIESLRRSSLIVRGKWWKTFAYFLLFYIIMYAVMYASSLVIGLVSLPFMGLFIFSALVSPGFFGAVVFLFLGIFFTAYIFMMVLVGLIFALWIKNMYLEFRMDKRKK